MAEKVKIPEPTSAIEDGLIYTSAGAARVLKVTERFLQHDRVTKRRIPFVKIGRFVRYRGIDLRRVVESNIVGGEVA